MTNREATELVEVLKLGHPKGVDMSPETAAIYATDLARFDYEEALAALGEVRRTNKFMPTIADIVNEIMACRMSAYPEWPEAWLLVNNFAKAMRDWRRDNARAEGELTSGEYDEWAAIGSPPLVSRPGPLPTIITDTLDVLGGLTALSEADNVAVMRAHFRDIYEIERRKRAEVERRELTSLPPTQQVLNPGQRAMIQGS